MGKATESHFAVLNKKMQNQKSNATVFNPEKILNPALRANKNPVQHEDKKELAKIKQMFLDAHYKRNSVGDKVQNFQSKENDEKNVASGEISQPVSVKITPKNQFLDTKKLEDIKKKTQDVKPSFTFLAKERVPYSYMVDHEAPPVGAYKPKYGKLDAD